MMLFRIVGKTICSERALLTKKLLRPKNINDLCLDRTVRDDIALMLTQHVHMIK